MSFCRLGPSLVRMSEAAGWIFLCQWEDKLQTEPLGLSPLQQWGSLDARTPILNQEHWGYLGWQTQGTACQRINTRAGKKKPPELKASTRRTRPNGYESSTNKYKLEMRAVCIRVSSKALAAAFPEDLPGSNGSLALRRKLAGGLHCSCL